MHACQSDSLAGVSCTVFVEPHSIIGDAQEHPAGSPDQLHDDIGRLGMLPYIVQALLCESVQTDSDRRRDRIRNGFFMKFHAKSGMGDKFLDQGLQVRGKRQCVEIPGMESVGQLTKFGKNIRKLFSNGIELWDQ